MVVIILRTLSVILIIHSVSLLAAGCTSLDTTSDYEGDEPGECADDADNDRDQLFDCDDPGCAGSLSCARLETTGEYEGDEPGECGDGADNDQDQLFDCQDPGCAGADVCSWVNLEDEYEEPGASVVPGVGTSDDSEFDPSPDGGTEEMPRTPSDADNAYSRPRDDAPKPTITMGAGDTDESSGQSTQTTESGCASGATPHGWWWAALCLLWLSRRRRGCSVATA